MPYVIKSKTADRYLCGTTSQKADYDDDGFVSIEYARIYATKSGAKSALSSWASVWDNTVFNPERYENYKDLDLPEETIKALSLGDVVRDQELYDKVEIKELKLSV